MSESTAVVETNYAPPTEGYPPRSDEPVPDGYSTYTGAPYADNPTQLVGPTSTTLNPATAVVGAPDVTVHVIGTGFVEGAAITFDGVDTPTTFVSSTDLSAVMSPGTAVPGDVLVGVRNPGGGVSTELPFTFTATAGAGA